MKRIINFIKELFLKKGNKDSFKQQLKKFRSSKFCIKFQKRIHDIEENKIKRYKNTNKGEIDGN